MAADLNVISSVIQLSVAPVFLLTGVGALLGVITNRLTRVVDRARQIEERLPTAQADERDKLDHELLNLERRARLIYRAITLLVLSALLVCALVVGLFVTAYYAWTPDLTRLLAAIFSVAMLALITGLLLFLREVYIATQTLRIGHGR
jgi:ribose/xylose/arabinose/galactoside ABC-type transport system permease subunit